jgi:hypothetical protein
MRRNLWPTGLALALALGPQAVLAHAFGVYDSAYNNFLEGAAVFLASPGLLVPVLVLAIALGLWRAEGLLAAWPHMFAGSVTGLALAPFAGPWVATTPLALGIVVAGLAALVPLARIAPALPWLAALVGLAVGLAALEGHGYDEVAMATRAGLLFAVQFALAAGAGLVRLSRDRFAFHATDILWRVAASWGAAILVLYLAFALKG